MRRPLIVVLGLVIGLVIGLPALAGAQAEPQPAAKPIGAIAALIGSGTITRAAETEPAPVAVRDPVLMRDKIQTAESSVIRVIMGGRITITIRERSIVTITDDPMRPRVDLESGRLAFKVHEGGLTAGQVGELRTPNAVTAIRGSLVVAHVNGSDSDVTVLEAHLPITIAPRDNPTQTTHLPIGHTVRVSGPRHAPRIGAVKAAAKEHLERAAELAEVPGRPRDGGQERNFKFEPRAAAAVHPSTLEGRAQAAQNHVTAPVERKREAVEALRSTGPARKRLMPEENATIERAERVERPPAAVRRFGIAR
jgi:hypothetical protein